MTLPQQIEALAGNGLTMQQIADCVGMHRGTLYRLKDKDSDVCDAIKRGRAKGIAVVSNALYENAKSGNVVAQIFYLKNRSPEEWRDRQDVVVSKASWVISATPGSFERDSTEWLTEHGLDAIEHDSDTRGKQGNGSE